MLLDVLKTVSLKTLSGKPSGTKPDRREKEYNAYKSKINVFFRALLIFILGFPPLVFEFARKNPVGQKP